MSAAPAPAESQRVPAWRLLLTAVLTVGLVVLFLSQVSIGRITRMIRDADLRLLLLASAAYALSYVGRVVRWRLLTTSIKVPWRELTGVTAVHNFMIRALPAKRGETSYVVLMRARGVPGTEAVAGLVLARIYDTGMVIVFFVLSVFLTRARFQGSVATNLAAAALILGLCTLAVLRGSLLVRFVNTLAGRVARARWIPGFFLGRGFRRRLDRLEASLEQIQSARQVPWILFWTLAIWIPSVFMTWWLLLAFGRPLGFWGTVFASTMAIVATLLPVGTLGNFGTQEAGWTLGVVLLEGPAARETAIATGFSVHLVGFALAGLFALLGAWLAGVSLFGPRDDRSW